jgi:hypothetical protein
MIAIAAVVANPNLGSPPNNSNKEPVKRWSRCMQSGERCQLFTLVPYIDVFNVRDGLPVPEIARIIDVPRSTGDGRLIGYLAESGSNFAGAELLVVVVVGGGEVGSATATLLTASALDSASSSAICGFSSAKSLLRDIVEGNVDVHAAGGKGAIYGTLEPIWTLGPNARVSVARYRIK